MEANVKRLIIVAAATLMAVAILGSPASPKPKPPVSPGAQALSTNTQQQGVRQRQLERRIARSRAEIRWHRAKTWSYQRQTDHPLTKTTYHERWVKGHAYLRWLVRLWDGRREAAKREAIRYRAEQKRQWAQAGNVSAWTCIHEHEGSWTDYGDPYWGGLQMDRGFMTTYGSDMIRKYGGYANLWSPLDQMIVAQRAHDGYNGYGARGYGPWPNTARMCGL